MSEAHRSGLSADEYHALTGFEGDWRDTWWDQAYLEFLGQQLGLDRCSRMLDLGCGVGHWGQRLLPLLAPEATLVGVDAESQWMDRATARAQAKGLEHARYQVADAAQLPFAAGSFDLVTCQTVLMHVADPEAVLAEAFRVLQPGGLFVAAEPNNFGNAAAHLMWEPRAEWSAIQNILELEYTCARGKEALGEGWYAVGERLPAALSSLGFVGVGVRLNNQCHPRMPPYTQDAPGIQVAREMHAQGAILGAGGTHENGLRMFLAGGGSAERYADLRRFSQAQLGQQLAAIDAGQAAGAGGHLHYLVWGRRP